MATKLPDESYVFQCIPEFHIDDSNRAALCFRETLIITLKNDSASDIESTLGGYCIQVELVGPQGREFLVHMHSSMTINGCYSGTKLVGSMTETLQCLEEKRTEFLHKENGLHKKSLYIGLEEDTYYVKTACIWPWNVSSPTETSKYCQYKDFTSEGANVLLMRYLAITNYEGVLRVRCITMDGEIAMSDYICTPLRNMELHGRYQELYTIERKIYKEDSLVHIQRNKTYLTSRGRIFVHDWLDIPYTAQKNPLQTQDETNETIDMQIPLRKRWMQDIEMFSKYLDMKSCNIGQYTDYLADYPETKQLIADYVQSLLVVKPVDVINFTIQYFKAFVKEPKIWDTDSFAKQIDIDINQQLLRNLIELKSDITCNVCGVCMKCRIASQFGKSLE